MALTVALAGDTMLGRGVGEQLLSAPPESLVDDEVVAVAREADLFLLNLECCISSRGEPWGAPGKPFFFRAPPAATELLGHLGVDCVTLANNHALDFGEDALRDTFEHLDAAGIAWVGAGEDLERARAPALLEAAGGRVAILGLSDHPADFAAGPERAGIAFADIRRGLPEWVAETVGEIDADLVLVTPHWGPNMTSEPLPCVREAARRMLEAGASLVAGHSAHVFHGVGPRVLYDLGDFLDDYVRDRVLRNDLGVLVLAGFESSEACRIEALPLKLDYAHTGVARGEDADWVRRRLEEACGAFGLSVTPANGRLRLGD